MFDLLLYVLLFSAGYVTHKLLVKRTQALVAAITADVKVHVDRVVTALDSKLK